MLSLPKPLDTIPRDQQAYTPHIGQYIAFTLYAETTLLEHADMDDIAITEAKAIQAKQYVGMVTLPTHIPSSQSPARQINLLPISGSLPVSDPDNFVEPHMCVPILPTTNHPTNREAFSTTPPNALPWPTVYHPSCLQFQVLAKTEYMPKPARYVELEVIDAVDLEEVIGQDLYARRLAWEASGKPQPELPRLNPLGTLFDPPTNYPPLQEPLERMYPSELFLGGSAPGDVEEEAEYDSVSAYSNSSCSSHRSPEGSFIEDDEDDTDYMMDAIESVFSLLNEKFESDPIVSVVYDLTTVPDLLDPTGFLHEMKELNAIMHRSRDRAYEQLMASLAQEPSLGTCSSRSNSHPSLGALDHDTACAAPASIKAMYTVCVQTDEAQEKDRPAPSCLGFALSRLHSMIKPRVLPLLRSRKTRQSSSSSASSTVMSEKHIELYVNSARFTSLAVVKKGFVKLCARGRSRWDKRRQGTMKGFKFDFEITLA